uniref:Macaca fascicularis brain cDNA clone: QflA-22056, similar to human hypothetical protein FLJ10803 (FLJ10803), mRNA, RefSeq: NM_018224.1 n=1 Tax=Macaca fascicularis TaxID=9541 RepID=I7GKJ5_MACFA|nr:unnamed protein product [Macaca fascicularis]
MGLFQEDLINVLFINKKQCNLSFIRLMQGRDAKGCWNNSHSFVLKENKLSTVLKSRYGN